MRSIFGPTDAVKRLAHFLSECYLCFELVFKRLVYGRLQCHMDISLCTLTDFFCIGRISLSFPCQKCCISTCYWFKIHSVTFAADMFWLRAAPIAFSRGLSHRFHVPCTLHLLEKRQLPVALCMLKHPLCHGSCILPLSSRSKKQGMVGPHNFLHLYQCFCSAPKCFLKALDTSTKKRIKRQRLPMTIRAKFSHQGLSILFVSSYLCIQTFALSKKTLLGLLK